MSISQAKILLSILLMTLSPYALTGSVKNAVSKLSSDETAQFFTTSGSFNQKTLTWSIPIYAWVYEPEDSKVRIKLIEKVLQKKYGLTHKENSREYFERRINLLIADNERGKQLIIHLAGKQYRLRKTNAKGHSFTVLEIPEDDIAKNSSTIDFKLALPQTDSRVISGKCLLPGSEGLSIISDIDDTVKISEVRDHKKLFYNTFYKEFITVPGMAELYRELASRGASLHFISSSPWQLYPELDKFFDENSFPQRSISLKTVRFRDSSFFNLFKKGDKTKPKQIAPLIERFPNRRFILIGDSGEQDAEVYHKIITEYDKQIVAAFIRELDGAKKINSDRLYYFNDAREIPQQLNNMAEAFTRSNTRNLQQ